MHNYYNENIIYNINIYSHYIDTDSFDNDQLNMHQAWSDLSYIEHEQERYVALRSKTVSELDAVRQQAVALENVICE